MFASFGGVTFDALSSPTKVETRNRYHFAKLDVIGAPPILQWIYDDLQEFKLTIYLHQVWTNPTLAVTQLKSLATTHSPQSLVWGGGTLAGNFVIVDLRVCEEWKADDGTTIACSCELELQEYITPQAAVAASQLGAAASPPGLTTSSSSAPGAPVITAPATSSESSIDAQDPFTGIPLSTIARGY